MCAGHGCRSLYHWVLSPAHGAQQSWQGLPAGMGRASADDWLRQAVWAAGRCGDSAFMTTSRVDFDGASNSTFKFTRARIFSSSGECVRGRSRACATLWVRFVRGKASVRMISRGVGGASMNVFVSVQL